MSYSYDKPIVFIETNIRTVIIHHFFKDKKQVADNSLRGVLEQLVPGMDENASGGVLSPRQFYWAMMDYGSSLKKTAGNLSRSSKHYKKQSKFHGSSRQLRGKVIRLLAEGPMTRQKLAGATEDSRLEEVLAALHKEKLVVDEGDQLRLGE
jgi:A/G-specific adenine glycosylase